MYFMIGSFSPFVGAMAGANYAESLSMISAKTWPDCQPTRHSPGPGIVTHRVRADAFRDARQSRRFGHRLLHNGLVQMIP
jgi:hypothetical protein